MENAHSDNRLLENSNVKSNVNSNENRLLEKSSMEADVNFLLNIALIQRWTPEKTLSELSIMRAFIGVEWSALGQLILNFLLRTIPMEIYSKTNTFYDVFCKMMSAWANTIVMTFPRDKQYLIVATVCDYLSEEKMDCWCTNDTILKCFKFLHNEKMVSTEAFETWALRGWLDIYATKAYKRIGLVSMTEFIRFCKNKDKH